jgi:hypothetical protein
MPIVDPVDSARMSIRIVVWNVAWASPSTIRGHELIHRIRAADPWIAILTEVPLAFLDALDGDMISSDPDYGYQSRDGRRKAAIWTRSSWSAADSLGSEYLPSGRFVAGSTSTPVGELRVTGVCIPWSQAHVTTGRRDRKPWQDHYQFLEGLIEIAAKSPAFQVLGGDFNQRIPRVRQPKRVSELLDSVLSDYTCVSGGVISPVEIPSIDHIAITSGLAAKNVRSLSNEYGDVQLSDHFGLACDLDVTAD